MFDFPVFVQQIDTAINISIHLRSFWMHRNYNFENFEQLWRIVLRVRSSVQHLLDTGGGKRFREKGAGRINPHFLDHAESDIHNFDISAVILCWVW